MILELAIDGLRLAAINTPNMLSTPLSIIGAIVLSDFAGVGLSVRLCFIWLLWLLQTIHSQAMN